MAPWQSTRRKPRFRREQRQIEDVFQALSPLPFDRVPKCGHPEFAGRRHILAPPTLPVLPLRAPLLSVPLAGSPRWHCINPHPGVIKQGAMAGSEHSDIEGPPSRCRQRNAGLFFPSVRWKGAPLPPFLCRSIAPRSAIVPGRARRKCLSEHAISANCNGFAAVLPKFRAASGNRFSADSITCAQVNRRETLSSTLRC